MPRPPDGGYGWVIVFAAFMCNFIYDGCLYGFGIILPELSRTYNQSKSLTALAGALACGILNIEGTDHVTSAV